MRNSTYQDGVQYARDVVNGDIVAGLYVKQACQRFLDDLERTDLEWEFSVKHANHPIKFIEKYIKHVKGQWKGKLIELEPWQVFIVINIYGWINLESKERRFQYALLEVARKNGKSLFASALALYDLLFNEEGAEVYSLATKRDQAKIAFDAAVQIQSMMPSGAKEKYKSYQNALTVPDNWAKYTPLGRDSKSLDGLNPSLCIFDEAAAYSDRNIIEVMTSATGARLNFLHLFITTAQFSKVTPYYEQRNYVVSMLAKKFDDDRYFGMIYTLDEGDEYTDTSTWIKANPGLDISVSTKFLQNEVNQAREIASKRNNVLVKHFNVWVSNAESWVDAAAWDRECNVVDEINEEGDLYIGMDLAMTNDLCAVSLLYVNGDVYHADFKCFLPQSAMDNATIQQSPLYRAAQERGTLEITDSVITDYDVIEEYIKRLARKPNFKAVAYDPYNSAQLVTNLEKEGINLLEIRQSIGHLSPASKETERMILGDKIKHTFDPFITWQLENCVSWVDVNENVKVRKGEDHTQKVDAIIAMIMAMALASGKLQEEEQAFVSFINF